MGYFAYLWRQLKLEELKNGENIKEKEEQDVINDVFMDIIIKELV